MGHHVNTYTTTRYRSPRALMNVSGNGNPNFSLMRLMRGVWSWSIVMAARSKPVALLMPTATRKTCEAAMPTRVVHRDKK